MKREGTYCFTSDMDWAPEHKIGYLLKIFREHDTPLTPFITNPSEKIARRYRLMPHNVGLHPNFLPDSNHGSDMFKIIEHVVDMWPAARCFRCHAYFEHTHVMREFQRRGFVYDSNICLRMQRDIQPLYHWTSIVKFPVFFEDDMMNADMDMLWRNAYAPGLKYG